GIFAFKCSRAEEIFNLLQDLMQCNSINVVEEPVVITRNSHPPERELPRPPQAPNSLGYAVPGFPNGFPSFPGEALSYSAGRQPSVSSLRHSSVGEDSTHALIGPDEQVNLHLLNSALCRHTSSLCRGGRLKLNREDTGLSGCSHRRTALLHYENLPSLPPVWECQPLRHGEEDVGTADVLTPSPSGYSEAGEEEPLQNYMNSENVALHGGSGQRRSGFLPKPRRSCVPSVFSFDFPRPCPEQPRQLNYIQVELEAEPRKGHQNPPVPRVPHPATHNARRTDSYAVIDLKKTAAMSSLQRALPRDDGTSRKTRHNSTDLPL
ncbi:FRS3 factor, partial [Columbina picui]|nr:FRS3 factor [Columbina picui]